ncbi:cation:proton antiporter [Luteibacter sp. UNCMF366Tsu5.1]|uniref:cation:proton antiporter n=1 Tax=Luteibacter sp. UNCMF366Tsu5.1 TaxID=1502758 RepID=UPI000908F148|nr:sodium:proton antiporter [Luteibacter sp. UNCMF366Tsu5.1]SFW21082.1 monovalent cation:H+ antiporter, CPA1 family [Luteibacter sp. UNCMF366Tsu5.1]
MALFESMLVLSLLAIVLLPLSRKLSLPYPTVLAAAGLAVAALPWAPKIEMDPQLALALFIAPALLDAAYDMPLRTLRRFWVPTVALAAVAVILTALAVAWLGVAWAGMPWAVALALGAIVAPPDAAAAAAMLSRLTLPRRTVQVLTAESLLNDAVALLIFGAAVATVTSGDGFARTLPSLALAAPGGVVLGIVIGRLYVVVAPRLHGTLGATLLEFVATFGVWVLAEELDLSPILCVVSYAMVIAHFLPARQPPRDRVHSYSVWAAMVFFSNVIAFLLVGLQARTILSGMHGAALTDALAFAGTALAVTIAVRVVWVMLYNRSLHWLWPRREANPTLKQGVVASWCGMRGLVTLATALALPADFPSRDLIVLTAFAVVLGTLVFQGTTLAFLVRWLRFPPDRSLDEELSRVRLTLLDAAEATLKDENDDAAEHMRHVYDDARRAAEVGEPLPGAKRIVTLKRRGIDARREKLHAMRHAGEVEDDVFHVIESELDWAQLAASSPEELEIEEG